MAGTFGVVPFCVHIIAYQLVPICYMFPMGIAMGLTVRIGSVIEGDVPRAKRIATYTVAFTLLLGALVSFCVYNFRTVIVGLFTDDEEIHEGCRRIWPYVSLHIFILHMHGLNQGLVRSLGLQTKMACVTVLTLWCTAVPVMYYVSIEQNGGIYAIWRMMPIVYLILEFNIAMCYVLSDWETLSRKLGEKRGTEKQISSVVIQDRREGVSEDSYLLEKVTI